MDLMAYWRWDNYVRDLDEGAGFHFNSNQERLHSEIEIGERLWLITGRRGYKGIQYLLVACLQVSAKTHTPPGYKYGSYRVWGDINHSSYYSAEGPDITDLLMNLEFYPAHPITSKQRIGQSLQTIRALSANDVNILTNWAKNLALEPRAYNIANEEELENSYNISKDTVRKVITEYHLGVSKQRKLHLQRTYNRKRLFAEKLKNLYKGRCQLCGFDPLLLYGVPACCSHHIVYLSRGGRDEMQNLILVCPNHHEVIHATNAVFDFKELHYVFPNSRREPLVLNQHLKGCEK